MQLTGTNEPKTADFVMPMEETSKRDELYSMFKTYILSKQKKEDFYNALQIYINSD